MLKEHKKMYKAGKSWVTAMVTIAAVALFTNVTTSVHADTVVNNTNNVATTEKVEDAQSYTEAAQQSTTANTDSNQNTANTNTNSNTSTDSSSNAQSQVASNGNQWTHFNGGWSYTDNQGNWVYNQWQRINNNWYYFNNGGYAQTGWFRSGAGNWYYFDNNNAWADTGWQYINNNWYYFDKDNAWALTGWQKLNNKWYYFDNNNAWALRGWQHINNSWYYFDWNNAWALTDWQRINNNWYYFDDNNAWALTGWHKLNNKWYYFDYNNAWALKGWQRINNNWYYFDWNNAWALTGWQKLNNKWYYFDPNNAWMLTGSQYINGATEYFLPSGEWDKWHFVKEAQNSVNAANAGNYDVNKDYAITGPNKIVLTNDQISVLKDWLNGKITDQQLERDPRFWKSAQAFREQASNFARDGYNFISNDADRSKTVPSSQAMGEMNRYFLALLNPIRVQLGLTPLTTNAEAQSLASVYGSTSYENSNLGNTGSNRLTRNWYQENHVAANNGFSVLNFGDSDTYKYINSILYGVYYTTLEKQMQTAGLQYPVEVNNGYINIDNLHHFLFNYITLAIMPQISGNNKYPDDSNDNLEIMKLMFNKDQFPADMGSQVNGHSKLHLGTWLSDDGTVYYIYTRDNTPSASSVSQSQIDQAKSELASAQSALNQAKSAQSQAQSAYSAAQSALTQAQNVLNKAKNGQADFATLQANLTKAKLAVDQLLNQLENS